MNAVPPLMTTISKSLSADFQNFGLVIIVQFFSFFTAAFFGGLLCEKIAIDSRKLTIAGLIIVSLTMFFGIYIKSFTGFIFWAIPLGVGGGLLETFASIMIAQYEKPKSSKLMNLSQIFFCVGAITAPQIVSLALYLGFLWKSIFILFSIIIALITVFFALFAKRNPDFVKSSSIIVHSQNLSIFRDKLFYLLSLLMFVYVMLESSCFCWISVYFEKALVCPEHISPLSLSVFWFGLIIGRLTVVLLPEKFSFWYAIFGGVILMLISSLLLSFISSIFVVAILLFFIGLGAGPIWPTTVAICHYARNNTSFTSYIIAVGSLGVAFGAWLGMAVVRYLGFGWFFPVITIGCSMLLLAAVLTRAKYFK